MSRWVFLLVCAGGLLAAVADPTPSLSPPADPVVPPAASSKNTNSSRVETKDAPASASVPVADQAAPSPVAHTTASSSAPSSYRPSEYLPDSIGAITVRPVPEPDEDMPPFLQQTDYYLHHHDSVSAADYLEKVAESPNLSPRDRARAILELADCLHAVHRPADELTWLKLWIQLYPDRPEVGAVAYRMGTLYTQLGLSGLARDSFYFALSNAVNHGQVQDAADLAQYSRLTTGTLWALAQNEYQSGDWARAAELFDRYAHEAQGADTNSLARAAYLRADCFYQLRQGGQATSAYQQALKDHPFHPLAPSARLRLYHLDVLAGHPEQAQAELEALVWTVRTVWPKDEALWQQRTAELLLELNRRDGTVLPPLLKKSSTLAAQDKAWQADLGHYDRLASLEATIPQATLASAKLTSPSAKAAGLREQDDLAAMQQAIDGLAPVTVVQEPAPKNPNPDPSPYSNP